MNLAIVTNVITVTSVIASLIGIVLYVCALQNLKKVYVVGIGIINSLISASMAAILIMVLVSAHKSPHPVIFNTLGLGGIVFTFLFIIIQIIYLFNHKSPIRQQLQRFKNTGVKGSPRQSKDTRFEETYRANVARDPHLSKLQILQMSFSLPTTDMYIAVRLHTKPLQSVKGDDDGIQNPQDLLSREQKELEQHIRAASDAVEIIGRHRHCVILGNPGVGKTTLLKCLAIKTAEYKINNGELPIFVDLNRLATRTNTDLLSFVREIVSKKSGFDLDQKSIEQYLHETNVRLYLDGLDETLIGPGEKEARDKYAVICRNIIKFAKKYSKTSIVVTSRNASYKLYSALERPDGQGFDRLYMSGFSEEDVQNFIKKWFDYSRDDLPEEVFAEDLISKLKHNPRLLALVSKPLLLASMVYVYIHRLDLPDRRAELYDKYVKTLLVNWDRSRGIDRQPFSTQEIKQQLQEIKQRLLEEIAWHFHKKAKHRFNENELLDVIKCFPQAQANITEKPFQTSENASRILNEILIQHGLIVKDGENDQERYKFLDLTFQEFFAAKYVLRNNLMEEQLLSYRGNLWWEEIIILYTDLLYQEHHPDDNHTFLQKLLEDDDIFYTNLALVGRCVATFSRPSQKVPLDIPLQLKNALEKTVHANTCTHLAQALAEIEGNTNEQLLLKMVANHQKNQALCTTLIKAAVECGGRSLLDKLVEGLVNEKLDVNGKLDVNDQPNSKSDSFSDGKLMPDTRKWIAEALISQTGEKRIASKLVEMLKQLAENGNQASSIKKLLPSIANTLSGIGERSICAELLRLLDKPKLDLDLINSITQVLGVLSLEDLEDIKKVLNLLEGEDRKKYSILVRQTIVESLARVSEKDVSFIVSYLNDIKQRKGLEPSIRYRVLIVLYVLGEQSEEQQLELRRMTPNESIGLGTWEQLVVFLKESQVASLVPILLSILRESRNKLEGLPQNSQDAALLRDNSIAITQILSKHGNQDIIDDLVALLSEVHTDQAVDASIVRVLGGYIRESSVVDKILKFLTEERFRTRLYLQLGCTEALGKVHGTFSQDSIYQQLRSLRNHPFEPLRISVLITLYKLEDISLRDELIQIFCSQKINYLRVTEDEQKEMSERLEHVLRTADDQDLVPKLREQLAKDWSIRKTRTRDDPQVRKKIVAIIGERAEGKEICEELINYLDDSDLTKEIYETLWKISRRITSRGKKLRIFKATDESPIQVEELELPK